MTKTNLSAALRAAFPHTIPIMTGYLAVGLAYGVLMASKGYNALWSGFVSAFAFCGSMQYVAITLLTSAFDPVQAFLLKIVVISCGNSSFRQKTGNKNRMQGALEYGKVLKSFLFYQKNADRSRR